MIKALTTAFENDISLFIIETNNSLIEIFDCYDCIPSLQRSYIKTEEKQPTHFTLNNPLSMGLVFAAIDNGILKSSDPSRCDFAIGNFLKLCFVEIKKVKTNQRNKAKSDAIEQLGAAISMFKEKINLNNTELIAIICINFKKVYPARTAASANNVVKFKDDYNAALMEGQSHIF